MSRPTQQADPAVTPWTFWVGLALGAPVGGYGVWWLLHNSRLTDPVGWVTTLVVAALGHDLLFVPLALGVGWVVVRVAPRWAAGPVLVALATSVVVTAIAIPVVTRYGERPSNPTLLPRDHGAALAAVLVVLWAGTGVAIAVRWYRRRRAGRPQARTGST